MLDQNALAIAARPPDIDTRTQNPSSRGLSRRSHGRRRCIYPAPFPWWILVAPGFWFALVRSMDKVACGIVNGAWNGSPGPSRGWKSFGRDWHIA